MALERSCTFADLLREYRRAAEMTQEDLAEHAGISVRALRNLESGASLAPRRDTLDLLAAALKLSAEERALLEASASRQRFLPKTVTTDEADVPLPGTVVTLPVRNRPVPLTPSFGREQEEAAAVQDEPSAPALPTGTVTFLITDLEGSTRLLQLLGSLRYATLLDIYHRLLRRACTAHGGCEIDTQGDRFFFAFSTGAEAVVAAVAAQRALATQPWPAGVPVRVRMGLHTGTPQVVGDHYLGLDVHRAAHIAACGYGGQVVLSQTTRDLVLDTLPERATLLDLGVHRLKDLQRSEHLWQLLLPDAPGLPAEFPPLQTLDARPHNLPIQLTPLVGREHETADLCTLLCRDDVPLVTLTGPGGVGKTRLALQVAAELSDHFPDGVWFVRLSRLVDPELVLPTIAQTLGVREVGRQPMTRTLAGYLHTKQLVLLLDNFEQVALAATELADLLKSCSKLKVLVTSRVALHLRGEKQYRVRPLPLPDPAHLPPPESLVDYPAVALFVQRAQDADAAFHLTNATALAIMAICARLDGLPLAIELAAAKVRILSPPALLARLERQLPILTGGARDAEARQQTMRSTLAWSEELLSPEEQRLFRRLAVFVSGFTLEAAEAVCAAPEGAEPLGVEVLGGLEALVDQGLVQPWKVEQLNGSGEEEQSGQSSEARFRMLFVVREYALERLEASGEAEALRRAHAGHFLALAEPADWHKELGREGTQWLQELEREHDNCRAALTWSCERREAELSLRLGAALVNFWLFRSYWHEGRTWVEELLKLWAGPTSGRMDGTEWVKEIQRRWGQTAARAWTVLLSAAGVFAGNQGELKRGVALLEKCVEAARAIGERAHAAANLQNIGRDLLETGEVVRGLACIEEALVEARQLDRDVEQRAYVLVQAGFCLLLVPGEEHRAQVLEEEGLELAQQGNLPYHEACAHSGLAHIAWRHGDLVQAGEHAAAALRVARDYDLTFLVDDFLDGLAIVAGQEGRSEHAARLQGAAAGLRETTGAVPEYGFRADIEATMLRGRATLGEAGWAAAFAAGQTLSVQEAIAEALGERG